MNRKYKVGMGDGSHRVVEATGPIAAKWEAERLAIDAGIDPLTRAAMAIRATRVQASKRGSQERDVNICRCKHIVQSPKRRR